MIIDPQYAGPLVEAPAPPLAGVVISSRIRLARNLSQAAFPGWAGEAERVRLCARMVAVLQSLPSLPEPHFYDMALLDEHEKAMLLERHLISHDLCERGAGSGLVVSLGLGVAIMINEEDHLRLQVITPGMRVVESWQQLDRVDSEIERRLDYAYDPELGYLTACPSNVGTGLRASVMLHLPGLKLQGEVERVIHGLEKIGLTARGMLGEGTEAHGNLFQISNQHTLGDGEPEILRRFVRIVDEVVQHEAHARLRLLEGSRDRLLDWVARACAVLTQARMLNSEESVDMLSAVRLGVELGLVRSCGLARINDIMLLTQPGHLQNMLRKRLGPEERDMERARLVRTRLQGILFDEHGEPEEPVKQT